MIRTEIETTSTRLTALTPEEFDTRFAAAVHMGGAMGLALMTALLDMPVRTCIEYCPMCVFGKGEHAYDDTYPEGRPETGIVAPPVGMPMTDPADRPAIKARHEARLANAKQRSFLLTKLAATDPTTRVEFDAPLGDLIGATERRIRAMVPETSKVDWKGSALARQWAVTALDAHGAPVAEFDLKMAR